MPRVSDRSRRVRNNAPILHVRSGLSPEKTLLLRGCLVVVLLSVVIAIFWFDRDGLKDQIDGHVSFSDILYFGMITVTTVGYGDIVPVSDNARLIDAFAVTPIRIFIWFIFLGTAYEFEDGAVRFEHQGDARRYAERFGLAAPLMPPPAAPTP